MSYKHALLFVFGSFFGTHLAFTQSSPGPKNQKNARVQTSLPKKTLAEELGVKDSKEVKDQTAQNQIPLELRADFPTDSGRAGLEGTANPSTAGALQIQSNSSAESIIETNDVEPAETSLTTQEWGKVKIRPNRGGRARGFFIAPGYLHSNWRAFSARLNDGSYGLRVGFFRRVSRLFEVDLGYFYSSGNSKSATPVPTYLEAFSTTGTFLFFEGPVQLTSGFELQYGSYKAWSLAAESENSITYSKHSGGVYFGAGLGLGARFKLGDQFSTDVNVSHLFIGDAADRSIGGWAVGLKFNWSTY